MFVKAFLQLIFDYDHDRPAAGHGSQLKDGSGGREGVYVSGCCLPKKPDYSASGYALEFIISIRTPSSLGSKEWRRDFPSRHRPRV